MKKNTEEIKQDILDKLKNKDIYIVGTGPKTHEFIKENCNKINIVGCLSFDSNHDETINVDGIDYIISPWNGYSFKPQDYLVVTERPLKYVVNRLSSQGYLQYVDYVESGIANVFLSGKKVAIFAGNCQIITLCDFISQIPEFVDQYEIFRFSSHLWKSRFSLDSLCFMMNFCDLYICLKHNEGDVLFFEPEEIPSSCKVITLASYLVPFYWPQLKMGRENSYNKYFIKNPNGKTHGPFEFGDVNINRLIEEGKDIDEILNIISDEDFYSSESVQNHLQRMIRMTEFEEAGCDVKLSEYIYDNYREEFLFRDFTHMQVELIWEYVFRLLDLLGIDTLSAEKIKKEKSSEICESYRKHCTEIPIYPSVAKALNIKWSKDKKYDVLFYSGMEQLTFEEYVRRYYKMCKACYDLLNSW